MRVNCPWRPRFNAKSSRKSVVSLPSSKSTLMRWFIPRVFRALVFKTPSQDLSCWSMDLAKCVFVSFGVEVLRLFFICLCNKAWCFLPQLSFWHCRLSVQIPLRCPCFRQLKHTVLSFRNLYLSFNFNAMNFRHFVILWDSEQSRHRCPSWLSVVVDVWCMRVDLVELDC